jgi:hypothetical protein
MSVSDMLEGGAGSHGALPGWQAGGLGAAALSFQIVKPDGQVAERGAVAGCFDPGHPAGVLAEGDIAHAVHAVFYRSPVADDEFEELLVGALVGGVARGVVGDLGFGVALVFGFGEVDGGALDGDESPAAAQAALLGGEAHGFDAAAHEFAVASLPVGLFCLRGKTPN